MKLKYKIIIPVILISAAILAKFILWDFAVSSGKRSGNLVKLSEKGKILKTWEGTLDLGSGDKLTFDFSIKNDEVAAQMYEHTGEYISISYEEHILGWPRDTKYNITSWSSTGSAVRTSGMKGYGSAGAQSSASASSAAGEGEALETLNRTLFCSVLGSIYQDQELYKKVKEHLKGNNLYLYRQIEKCND